MKFKPLTEEQINSVNLMDEGIYDFHVFNAEDTLSKKGKEMIKLYLKVWGSDGKERNILDYLIDDMLYKIKHFCDAMNITEKYNSGSLSSDDCVGKSGKLEIIIQKGKKNPNDINGGNYPDRNSVQDYIVENKVSTENKEVEPDLNDDIPF